MEIARAVLAGEIEGVDGSSGADKERFDAETAAVDRTGWRGEVEDEVNFAGVEGLADVLFEEAEAGLTREMVEIGQVSRAEVINSNDRVSFNK